MGDGAEHGLAEVIETLADRLQKVSRRCQANLIAIYGLLTMVGTVPDGKQRANLVAVADERAVAAFLESLLAPRSLLQVPAAAGRAAVRRPLVRRARPLRRR